jgi:uncharacterized membrane protein YfcA
MSTHHAALIVITLGAAFVNGALGYGFSSITVPLALLFLSNRALNPALVLAEVALNTYVLWVNRAALPQVWRRVLPVTVGLAPGVLLGCASPILRQRRNTHAEVHTAPERRWFVCRRR